MFCACARSCCVRWIDGLKLLQRRVWQAREIARLVDQHLRLILQRGDLVVDLLQLARRGQDILRVVVGIEHDGLCNTGVEIAMRRR